MSGIIEKIKRMVMEEDSQNLYQNHIRLVVTYASRLANIEGEDENDLMIASLLHDIGRIRYGGKDHNITGAEDTRAFLEREGYDPERTNRICNAIVTHRGEEVLPAMDKFSEILRCADGLSHLDIIPLLLTFQLKKTPGDLAGAIKKIIEKIDFEWNNKITLKSARKIGLKKYKAARLLLESNLHVLESDECDC